MKRNIVWRLGLAVIAAAGVQCIDTVNMSSDATEVTDAISIATRAHHTCAVTSAGSVMCWGLNKDGQLGSDSRGTLTQMKPTLVSGLVKGVKSIAAGVGHTCALTLMGDVRCWGASYYGQVGNGSQFPEHPSPSAVGLSGVTQIAAGDHHTCALLESGGVKCWGWNYNRQLGNGSGDEKNSATPVDVVGLGGAARAIAAGEVHTCAAMEAGGVKCWGNNTSGALGDGRMGEPGFGPANVVGISGGVKALAAGRGYTCAVTDSGGVKCWGWNYAGQLGDGTTIDRATPVDVPGLSSGFVGVAASDRHTCAWNRDGDVWCWGSNWAGEVGDGTSDNTRYLPVRAAALPGVATSVAVGRSHTCVMFKGGAVHCFGANEFGALGIGSRQDRAVDGRTLSDGYRVYCL